MAATASEIGMVGAEKLAPSQAAASAELAASLAQGEPAGEKRGRGRPSKAALPATGIAPKIKTLYINCGPVGVAVTDATDIIALAKQRVAEAGLADYRFADFGQGPGMLSVAAVSVLDGLEGILPAVRVDASTPEGAIVLTELVARAELVVR
jgi:hypothetical protein